MSVFLWWWFRPDGQVSLENELSKHSGVNLHMLVGLSKETLPHSDSSDAKFNDARSNFPKLENLLVSHAVVYVRVRLWGLGSICDFHSVRFAHHCNTKELT